MPDSRAREPLPRDWGDAFGGLTDGVQIFAPGTHITPPAEIGRQEGLGIDHPALSAFLQHGEGRNRQQDGWKDLDEGAKRIEPEARFDQGAAGKIGKYQRGAMHHRNHGVT